MSQTYISLLWGIDQCPDTAMHSGKKHMCNKADHDGCVFLLPIGKGEASTFGVMKLRRLPADLKRSQDECNQLRGELAKAQQAARALHTDASPADGGASAKKLQAECEELNLEMQEALERGQTARREATQLQGDLRGKNAELQHYKNQLEE